MNEYMDQFMSEFKTEFPRSYSGMNDIYDTDKLVHRFKLREDLTKKYAFAIPTDKAIRKLVELSPLIEICAGTGYWAKLISEAGGDIIAIDNGERTDFTHKWFEIQKGTHDEVSKYPDRTLLLCWPPLNDIMAYETVELYKGETVVYIGEGDGGCNATEEFFEYLEKNFVEQETIAIPQWPGIHDYFVIWRRK